MPVAVLGEYFKAGGGRGTSSSREALVFSWKIGRRRMKSFSWDTVKLKYHKVQR